MLLHLYQLSADRLVDGLTRLFQEIRVKDRIADLTTEYQKFAEWLRIEFVFAPIVQSLPNNNVGSLQQSTISSSQRITHPSCLRKLNEYIL